MGLIDIDATIEVIEGNIQEIISESGKDLNEHTNRTLRRIVKTIKGMPTTEERKGKWVRLESGSDGCNQCWENDFGWARFNYCPNCGAKMEVAE